MDHVWDNSVDSFSNSLRHISALRKNSAPCWAMTPSCFRIGEGYLMGGEVPKRPLQWRITLMSVLLIGITCVTMNCCCAPPVCTLWTPLRIVYAAAAILNDGGARALTRSS